MNTPGFKSSHTNFAAQFAQGQGGSVGTGVVATAAVLDFKNGDPTLTQDMLNLFIHGDTFFVLKDSAGHLTYSRDGEFSMADGYLVGSNGARVQRLNANGTLSDISVSADYAFRPPAATQTLTHGITDTLSTNTSTSGSAPASPPSTTFTVYDRAGGSWQLRVQYTRVTATPPSTDNSWKCDILDANGNPVAPSHTITFNPTGTAVNDPAYYEFDYKPGGSDGLKMNLRLDYSNLKSISQSQSNLAITADGHPRGDLLKEVFNEKGQFVISYSAGDNDTSQSIALARFSALNQLDQVSSGTFINKGPAPKLEYAGANGDSLQVGFIERSNVDLSAAFNELIVVQRGYQAAAELGSTASSMLDALLSRRGG
jgi:flagellar hook protein FlgE